MIAQFIAPVVLTPKERRKIKQREHVRNYRLRHPDRVRAQTIRYKAKTPREKWLEIFRRYRRKKKIQNPRYFADQMAKWREKNRAAWNVIIARAKRKRYANDPTFRIKESFYNSLRGALRRFRQKKSARFIELLGCTVEQLRRHIEQQFKPGMTWENKGQFGWHIDHRKPCASFNLRDPLQQKECFHYTNLQPMWWRDNLLKRDKT